MSVAEITSIVIEKGTYFEATFNLFDADNSASFLSGLSETYASIRKYPKSKIYEEFEKAIDVGSGTIVLSLTSEQTSRLSAGRNYFDVVITINNKKIKVIKGTAIVEESVSV